MERFQSDIKLIEKYHYDCLNAAEREDFEKRMAQDSAFEELFNQHIRFLIHLQAARRSLLKQQLQRVDQSMPTYRRKRFKKYVPAVTLLTILLTGAYLIFQNKTSALEKLVAKYEQLESGGYVQMNDQNEINLTNSFNSFRQRNYETALTCLYSLPPSAQKNYYSGIYHYFLQHYDSATKYFNLVKTEDQDLEVKSAFYMVLTLIKIREHQKAVATLKTLQNQQTTLQKEIDLLLKTIPDHP